MAEQKAKLRQVEDGEKLLKNDGSTPLAADLPAGGHRITGLAAPSGASDAVTKSYADALTGQGTYVHVQNSPLLTWTINHNLGSYPSVTVIDSGNSVVIGSVTYVDTNTISIHFSAAFSGKAYLN